jgi:hypothetical protein
MRWARAMTVMTVAALGLASSACAAHYGSWGYQERHYDPYRIGWDRGFDDGARHGHADGRHHDSYDFHHAKEYRHADRGYRYEYGSRQIYADGYRRGYEQGYRKAFDEARHEHRRAEHRPR